MDAPNRLGHQETSGHGRVTLSGLRTRTRPCCSNSKAHPKLGSRKNDSATHDHHDDEHLQFHVTPTMASAAIDRLTRHLNGLSTFQHLDRK
jgi:hypothetical protein